MLCGQNKKTNQKNVLIEHNKLRQKDAMWLQRDNGIPRTLGASHDPTKYINISKGKICVDLNGSWFNQQRGRKTSVRGLCLGTTCPGEKGDSPSST